MNEVQNIAKKSEASLNGRVEASEAKIPSRAAPPKQHAHETLTRPHFAGLVSWLTLPTLSGQNHVNRHIHTYLQTHMLIYTTHPHTNKTGTEGFFAFVLPSVLLHSSNYKQKKRADRFDCPPPLKLHIHTHQGHPHSHQHHQHHHKASTTINNVYC